MSHLTLSQVVEHDYCVGCGVCASQTLKGTMTETAIGTYIPNLRQFTLEEIRNAEEFCPFSKNSDAEDRLATEAFASQTLQYLDGLGYYHKTYAGYAIEAEFRNQGSSAGLVNWLCAKLLSEKIVETVLHVKEDKSDAGAMYSYQESSSVEELIKGAKSKYYPIELSGLLKTIENSESESIAVVGLPCFIKSLRGLGKQNPIIKRKLKFYIGIVCGHLKSKHYAEFLAWQAGVTPGNLEVMDFRTKIQGRPASSYGFTAQPSSNDPDTWIVKPMSEVIGGNWGHGMFKLNACEYCDDVMAETADIVFGDAWLPEFTADSNGTNIVNSRSRYLTSLLEAESEKGAIKLIELSPQRVLDSQRSGLKHRREGYQYRAHLNTLNGKPFPKKRTVIDLSNISPERKVIYEYREMIRQASHKSFLLAKECGELSISMNMLKPIIDSYAGLNRRTLSTRIIGKVKRVVSSVLRVKSRVHK